MSPLDVNWDRVEAHDEIYTSTMLGGGEECRRMRCRTCRGSVGGWCSRCLRRLSHIPLSVAVAVAGKGGRDGGQVKPWKEPN